MKLRPIILIMLLMFTSVYVYASDDCDYYIDHQIARFIYSVESEPSRIIEIEYYFKDDSNAVKFSSMFDQEIKIVNSEWSEVGKLVKIKHHLQAPRFHLEGWFSSHYRTVCAHNGYINNWVTDSEG